MAGVWDRMIINTVVFKTVTAVPDTSSDTGKQVASAGTTLKASVQPADPNRVVAHAEAESVVSHTLFFNASPFDTSSGARQPHMTAEGEKVDAHCQLMDLFLWAEDPNDPSRIDTFYATGKAVNLAGWDQVWKVDCILRT